MDGYGNTPDTEQRLREVERRILDGEGLPKLRAWVADRFNLSPRQAREIVRTASQRVADSWDIERGELLPLRLTQLEALAALAMEKNQLGVALAAWRHADDLIGMAARNYYRRKL